MITFRTALTLDLSRTLRPASRPAGDSYLGGVSVDMWNDPRGRPIPEPIDLGLPLVEGEVVESVLDLLAVRIDHPHVEHPVAVSMVALGAPVAGSPSEAGATTTPASCPA